MAKCHPADFGENCQRVYFLLNFTKKFFFKAMYLWSSRPTSMYFFNLCPKTYFWKLAMWSWKLQPRRA